MTTRRILAEVALGLLCLSACWPLVELSKADSVGVPIVVAALVMWAIGAGVRRVGARSWLIVLAQAAAVVVSPLAALAAHGVSPTRPLCGTPATRRRRSRTPPSLPCRPSPASSPR